MLSSKLVPSRSRKIDFSERRGFLAIVVENLKRTARVWTNVLQPLDWSTVKAIAQRTRLDGVVTEWALTVENSTHNHGHIMAGSHPSIRGIAMIQEVKNIIVNQTRSGAKPKEILIGLRLSSKANEEDPIYKPSDIYNVKSKARSEALGSMIST